MTGIEPKAEIVTMANLEVDFENSKEVKEKVECDKDIQILISNVNVSSVVAKLILKTY